VASRGVIHSFFDSSSSLRAEPAGPLLAGVPAQLPLAGSRMAAGINTTGAALTAWPTSTDQGGGKRRRFCACAADEARPRTYYGRQLRPGSNRRGAKCIGQSERRSVFLDCCIGHGAPPSTRCVVASPGASIRCSARRGAIIVAPRPRRLSRDCLAQQLRQLSDFGGDPRASSGGRAARCERRYFCDALSVSALVLPDRELGF
jgi:hypothetical protein